MAEAEQEEAESEEGPDKEGEEEAEMIEEEAIIGQEPSAEETMMQGSGQAPESESFISKVARFILRR